MSGLAKRLHDGAVRIRHQDGVSCLVLGDPRFGFGGGELRFGCIRCGLRLLVALPGGPSIIDEVGVSPLIRIRLNDGCARCGDGVALRRKRKTQIGFVDPHQRLPGFDLLTDIHKSFDDLTGDAKAKVAFHPRAYGARETAFGSAHPRGRHQADHRRFLPRIACGGSFLGGNSKSGEDSGSRRRDQDACHDQKSALSHCHLPDHLDFVRPL